MMPCPLCQAEIETPTEGKDVKCSSCKRTWYATGWPEAPIASRKQRVRMTKLPEVGDKVTDILKPLEDHP